MTPEEAQVRAIIAGGQNRQADLYAKPLLTVIDAERRKTALLGRWVQEMADAVTSGSFNLSPRHGASGPTRLSYGEILALLKAERAKTKAYADLLAKLVVTAATGAGISKEEILTILAGAPP